MVKICPNRGHIFKNKLRNAWAAILKYQHFQARNLCVQQVGSRKKTKIKTYKQKIGVSLILDRAYSCRLLWQLWASIHCESKMEKQVYKLGKVDDRIQILQPARSRKTQMVFNQARKIQLKTNRQLHFRVAINQINWRYCTFVPPQGQGQGYGKAFSRVFS